jgi:hypothetical protein
MMGDRKRAEYNVTLDELIAALTSLRLTPEDGAKPVVLDSDAWTIYDCVEIESIKPTDPGGRPFARLRVIPYARGMEIKYPEIVSIRLPEGTRKRMRAFIASPESEASFWRMIMLSWLTTTENKARADG